MFLSFFVRCFVVTPIDGKFGNKEDSGNWTGMVGMLQHKQADVAISSFSYTFTRKLAMDFSPPVEYSSVFKTITSFIFQNILEEKNHSNYITDTATYTEGLEIC